MLIMTINSKSKLKEILEDPKGRELIIKHAGADFMNDPKIKLAMGMTPKMIGQLGGKDPKDTQLLLDELDALYQ
jgi:hypothetical protein